MAAYKRPAADSSGKWLIEAYFETGWMDAGIPTIPLPVALNIKSLYEQMLMAYIDLPPRAGETLDALVKRVGLIRKHQCELRALEAKMNKEKQFNRKVELNSRLNTTQARLEKFE